MIRFVKPCDIDGVRALIKESFGCDEAYLDLYLERNPAPRRMCCIEDGRVVSFLAAFPVDYVSGEMAGGFHRTWHGYYLHGLCTAPEYRRRGYAAALIDYCAATTGRDGWEFLILRPQAGEKHLVNYYRRLGFTIDLNRQPGLPGFESPQNITGMHAGELFLKRYNALRCNYFQWSAPMLHYIIREARLNPGRSSVTPVDRIVTPVHSSVAPGHSSVAPADRIVTPGLTGGLPCGRLPIRSAMTASYARSSSCTTTVPYAMLRPFSTDFRLSSPDAVFSYPMD